MDEKPISKSNLLIPFSIIFAGLIIGGAVYFSNNRSGGAAVPGAKVPAVAADISKVVTDGRPFIGNPNAKVTIAYWFDYQCPYCKLNEQKNISQIVAQYVQTGKVKIVFKDYQFLGMYSKDQGRDDSMSAALMARAVWEVSPEKFYDWHSAVMNKQDDENAGWGSEADLLALTKTIPGVDAVKVQGLMVSKKAVYEKMINEDRTEGASFGIEGTPAMIVGKEVLGGYIQDFPKISGPIDALLK